MGEAASAPEAIEVVRSTHPDLVVCDLSMPGGGGIAVVKACAGNTRIVVLTVSEAERDLLDVVAAGAVGYLVKSTPGPELRAALSQAPRRATWSSPPPWRHWSWGSSGGCQGPAPVPSPCPSASEVLQLVARGHSYRQIGAELFIAEKTVENHVRNILGKLHLSRRQELVRYALEHGIE